MTAAVQEHIIRPMLALYPPPVHLRQNAKSQAAALAAYVDALAGFDAATLAAGWRAVTAEHRFWCWPSIGTVVEACRRFAPPPPALGEQEKRRRQAEALADAYTARFMKTTHVARLARAEGWELKLGEYVRDAAWVQAQLICGVRGISFASTLVPPEERHISSAAEFFACYCETIAAAVERCRIRVTVPPARLREWKDRAGAAERERPAGRD